MSQIIARDILILKTLCCSSEIQAELGALYFIWQLRGKAGVGCAEFSNPVKTSMPEGSAERMKAKTKTQSKILASLGKASPSSGEGKITHHPGQPFSV